MDRDTRVALSLGSRGTHTAFVNGYRFTGVPRQDALDFLVKAALLTSASGER